MAHNKAKNIEKLSIEQLEKIANFIDLKVTMIEGEPHSSCDGMLLTTSTALLSLVAQNEIMDNLRIWKIKITFSDGITQGMEDVSLDLGSEKYNRESKTRQEALILVLGDMLEH